MLLFCFFLNLLFFVEDNFLQDAMQRSYVCIYNCIELFFEMYQANFLSLTVV